MKEDFCVYLDAGHGGLDEDGTYVTAPSKQFKHSRGTFHGNGWFYEGVWNRVLVNRVADKLKNLDIHYKIVSHEYLDFPLQYRVDTANWYYRNYKKGIFISTHSNAANGHARGFEVYTTRGKTKSDQLAELLWEEAKELLTGEIRFRSDVSDGDSDRERNFFVIRRTIMPAILVEHLFFDNYDDAKLLMNGLIVDKFAEAQVRAIIRYINQ